MPCADMNTQPAGGHFLSKNLTVLIIVNGSEKMKKDLFGIPRHFPPFQSICNRFHGNCAATTITIPHAGGYGVPQIQGGERADVLPVLQALDNAVDAVPSNRLHQ